MPTHASGMDGSTEPEWSTVHASELESSVEPEAYAPDPLDAPAAARPPQQPELEPEPERFEEGVPLVPELDAVGQVNAARAAAEAAAQAEEDAKKAARRAEMDAKYTPGGTKSEANALGPGYDESTGGASGGGMGARTVESLFDAEIKGASRTDVHRQDPRVQTRIISDAELAAMIESGTPPKAVKSSLKKRKEKGGLLGKAGLRDVESTGMPQELMTFAIATKTAPVILPIGWVLYGFGTFSLLFINEPYQFIVK